VVRTAVNSGQDRSLTAWPGLCDNVYDIIYDIVYDIMQMQHDNGIDIGYDMTHVPLNSCSENGGPEY
jgi:hypothetical protein